MCLWVQYLIKALKIKYVLIKMPTNRPKLSPDPRNITPSSDMKHPKPGAPSIQAIQKALALQR